MATKDKTIPLSTLQTTETPAKVIQPAPATGAEGVRGTIEAMGDAFTQGLTEKRQAAEKDRDTSFSLLTDAFANSDTEIDLTDQIYSKNVDPLERELIDINNDIRAEEHGLRRRLEKLDKNEQGLFGGALEDEKDRITKESLTKQADLAVIQLARQGRFDSAKAIADRFIQAKLEKQTQRNELLKFMYLENKDMFTLAEQREFETKQGDRDRELDFERDKEMARFNQILDKELISYRSSFEGGGSGVVSLTTEDKQKLLAANFTSSEISQIAEDVSAYGLSSVLEGISDPAQRKAIESVYGGASEDVITRESVSKLYGLPDDGSKTGFLGLGKTTSQKLDDVMATVERYRAVGLSDPEIRTKLLAK